MTHDPDYSGNAYRACLHGNADARQQMSAASQIILLNAVKAEMISALEEIARMRTELSGDFSMGSHQSDIARKALERARRHD